MNVEITCQTPVMRILGCSGEAHVNTSKAGTVTITQKLPARKVKASLYGR